MATLIPATLLRMIKYLDLQKINARHEEELHQAANRVISGGWYLQGSETAAFEEEYARYLSVRHCITCANGLDALTLILRAYIELGEMHVGDEILVPANTYIASILAISENGLTPVLVEPRIDTFQIDPERMEEKITSRTRGVMLVHLYGRCAYNDQICALLRRYDHLQLIEDNAQAHGCTGQHRRTVGLGDVAAHSFYPGKNLGALGDAGAVTTNRAELAEVVRALGNYGSNRKYVFDFIGRNSRIDEIQAALLRVKLNYLDADNRRRQAIASKYITHICNPKLTVPTVDYLSNNVFHIFPLLCRHRDYLQTYLLERGIQTLIHYPIPPHRQRCYAHWNELSLPITEQIHRQELSLPLHPALTDDEVDYIIAALNDYE